MSAELACFPRRSGHLQDVRSLMQQLAREQASLVRGAPEREPRQGREVRGCRDRDDEQDDEGETEQLARASAQGHVLDLSLIHI